MADPAASDLTPADPTGANSTVPKGAIYRPAGPGVGRFARRFIVVLYLLALVVVPVALVFFNAFKDGLEPVIEALTDPIVLNALRLTLIAAIFSVVLNVVFGVAVAILLVRYEFPGKRTLSALIDLPLSVSPVVVGLSLVIVYNARDGLLGAPLAEAGIQVLFSTPGIVLATTFVAMPLVVREVVPVLEEQGIDQEQAARSLGAGGWTTFRRITLPGIRWGVIYGTVLCFARSIGEFGAVKVVSGNLTGKTQTATLVVEQMYQNFNQAQAFTIAAVLAGTAIIIITIVAALRVRVERRGA